MLQEASDKSKEKDAVAAEHKAEFDVEEHCASQVTVVKQNTGVVFALVRKKKNRFTGSVY